MKFYDFRGQNFSDEQQSFIISRLSGGSIESGGASVLNRHTDRSDSDEYYGITEKHTVVVSCVRSHDLATCFNQYKRVFFFDSNYPSITHNDVEVAKLKHDTTSYFDFSHIFFMAEKLNSWYTWNRCNRVFFNTPLDYGQETFWDLGSLIDELCDILEPESDLTDWEEQKKFILEFDFACNDEEHKKAFPYAVLAMLCVKHELDEITVRS